MAQTKIIGGGTIVPGVELGIDPTFQAARVSLRPIDHSIGGQILGHYRTSGNTTAAAFSGNAVLCNFRWADPSRYAVILKVIGSTSIVTSVTAQRTDPLFMTIQRAYTVSETTNATSILPTGNSGKARVNMASTLAAQISVASAAAGISGGTRTADNTPMALVPLDLSGGLGAGTTNDEFVRYEPRMHPLVLSSNEGFTISWGATTLATGTIEASFVIEWAEVVTI
jgi:hypothetical protein